jgi:branched-subunit amino acid aminotransferase/4-amino-4-deoxychorismate lyase
MLESSATILMVSFGSNRLLAGWEQWKNSRFLVLILGELCALARNPLVAVLVATREPESLAKAQRAQKGKARIVSSIRSSARRAKDLCHLKRNQCSALGRQNQAQLAG